MHVCPECGESLQQGGYCPADGNPLMSGADDPLLGQTVGQYRIARLLGVGGMGRVYKAVHPSIGSRVAVKVLSRDCADNRQLVDRFFAEARAVNLIRHENIINVLDLSTLADGRPYITMEYLDGQPLAAVMERAGPLPLGSLARLVGEVLNALIAAHEKGIVHRDLKPDNIFVSPQGRAKVLDFGIAKLMPELSGGAGPTRTGSLLGTPHYMSPEQANAQPVDARTDVYAMGVILFEGATGHRPFTGASLFELLRQVLEQPPPPPRSLRPDMPPAYEALVLRAMAKDPSQRFQSAAALAEALAAAVQELPPQAWTPITPGTSPSARIGPPSLPTPANTTPQPASLGTAPTEVDARPPARSKNKALLFGLLVVAFVAVAVGVTLAVSGGDDKEVAQSDPPANPAPVTQGSSGPSAEIPDTSAALAEHAERIRQASEQMKAQIEEAQKKAMDMAKSMTSGTYVLPGTYRPKGFDPAKFDVSGFLGEAERKAKEIYSDAVLVRIDAQGVRPDGRADLTLARGFNVLYRFASPSRAKRPKDLPRGVEHEANCQIFVYVDPTGVRPYALKGWKCDMAPTGEPRCTVEKVWRKAEKKGAPAINSVAQIGYWADRNKRVRWWFQIDGKHSYFLKDDC